ncbi:MAG: hypothetical protein J3K34DRAFT_413574 [Monoraphidium minutum]|nr:MAG: hypothetical protein J3K34DRAFT_413574 [Monoraphidium minutum]
MLARLPGLRNRCCAPGAPRRPHPSGALPLSTRPSAAGQQRRRVMASASLSDEAMGVVQRQLEAYNARDLEAFMAVMADDVVALDAETGAVIATGAAELRPRYVERFKTPVYSELLSRVMCGATVVDRERISGLPGGEVRDCLAIYTIRGGKIARMQFVWKLCDS